jgi:hypothetical protein
MLMLTEKDASGSDTFITAAIICLQGIPFEISSKHVHEAFQVLLV